MCVGGCVLCLMRVVGGFGGFLGFVTSLVSATRCIFSLLELLGIFHQLFFENTRKHQWDLNISRAASPQTGF